MVLWCVIGFILVLIASCEFYALKTGVPTVTSNPSARRKMIELLKAEAGLRTRERPFTILDLGSGTGKLTLEIGRALPSARVVGLEISLVPYLLSLLRQRIWGLFWGGKNVAYKRVDFWPYDLSGVDAVVIFINGSIRERMAAKLKADLPSGALIISNEMYLPGWGPLATHAVGFLKLKVVVYRQA